MKDVAAFLTADQVLSIPERMIAEFGGEGTVRDQGLLESAVMMPSAQFGGKFLHKGIPGMAAAYLFHVCRNRPFVDGNKRTALAAAEVFILSNKRILAASNRELEDLTMGVASGKVTKAEATEFFSRHVKKPRKKK